MSNPITILSANPVIEGPFLDLTVPAEAKSFSIGTYYKNGSVLAAGNPAQIDLAYEDRTVVYTVRYRATAYVTQGAGMYTYPSLYTSPGTFFKLRERRFTPNPEDLFLPTNELVFGEYEEIWATDECVQRKILSNLTTKTAVTVAAGWYFLDATYFASSVGGIPTWYERANSTATAYPRWDAPVPSAGTTWIAAYDAATPVPLADL